MAAPSVRSFTSNVSATPSLSLNKPTGTASGDLLLAILFPVGPPDATKTVTPSDGGFTEITAASTFVNDGAWRGNLRAFRKEAGGSEPTSYGFTSANVDHFAGVLVAIQGAVTDADPAAVQASIADAASLILSGLSAAEDESLILVAQIGWDTLGDAALPTAAGLTFTEQFDDLGNDIAFATAIKATAGAVGSIAIAALDFRFCAFALAIAPAAGGSPQTISPSGIASAEAFGSQTISPGGVTIAASGIASAEVFGNQVLRALFTLLASGIASGEAFGSPALASLYTFAPSGIPSAEAFGSPAVSYSIAPNGIASAEVFGSHALAPGIVLIVPDGIASLEAFGDALISAGGLVLSASGIASAEAFGSQTLQSGEVLIAPAGIASAETFGAAGLSASYTIVASGIVSAEAFGNPALNLALLLIAPLGIPSAEAFGSVLIIGGGAPLALAIDNRTFNVTWIDDRTIAISWDDDQTIDLG